MIIAWVTLKPSLYNNNPILHTLIHLVQGTPVFLATPVSPGGNTHFPRIRCLARGKHPHFAHLSLARSEDPLRLQGFGSLPISRPGLGKPPTRQYLSSLRSPLFPTRAGIPLLPGGLTPRSCRNRLTIHFKSKQQIPILFRTTLYYLVRY